MTEKILLPVDLAQAEVWKKAIDEAIAMARRRKAELHVLWVVPSVERNLNAMPEDKQPKLTAFVAQRFPDDVTVRGHLRSALGAPHREIRKVAEELGASVIVMGSHNPRFTDVLMGSNASHVTLHARCSVYVVR